MNILIIGQGIAGSCLAWELKRRGAEFTVADRPIAETASRVAAGLVNPLTGRAFRPGWRQEECLAAAEAFYPETERELGGSWWQKTPIFREVETEDQFEIWQERQTAPESCAYAGPLFPWPERWEGRGKAAYTRGSAVLHVENMVTAMRRFFMEQGRFVEADVSPADIRLDANGLFHWNGRTFSHIVWCTGWEAGLHPDMSPLKGRPSKGTILDLDLKELDWHAGILHFGHWLVHNGSFWRFGATYAWAWDAPGIPEAPAVQELMLDLVKRYSGNMDVIRARAAVRPIIRRSQPVAGPIPGLDGQFVFSGLGSKGVTTSPLVRRPACRTSRVRNGSAAGSAACRALEMMRNISRPSLNGTAIFLVKRF